jgi:hypothetical protein
MSVTGWHGSVAAATIQRLDWRIDVLISTLNHVQKVNVPVIVLSLTLSTGAVLVYRLTAEEFHQWRFSLAKAVRDMAYLEKKKAPSNWLSGDRGAKFAYI